MNPKSDPLSTANLNIFSQSINQVDLFRKSQTSHLTGMVFYAENRAEIGRAGYTVGLIKTIKLQEDERIIGFRASSNGSIFTNFQFVLDKRV